MDSAIGNLEDSAVGVEDRRIDFLTGREGFFKIDRSFEFRGFGVLQYKKFVRELKKKVMKKHAEIRCDQLTHLVRLVDRQLGR